MKAIIENYNSNFQGEITLNGKKYYLPGVIKGEEVEVTLNKEKGFVKLDKVITPSKIRVNPPCDIYQKCGGCHLLHIAYQEQLKLKNQMVIDLFKNAGIKAHINDIIGMKDPKEYRNKNQVVFGYDDKRRVVSGFYQEFTHKIVNFTKCYVQDPYADEIVSTIKELMFKMHLMPYNEDKGQGLIRHVMIKRSKVLNQTMVIVVTSSETFPGRQNFIKALLAKHKDITTIVQNVNSKKTTQVLGDKDIILYGKGYINDILCDKKFIISPKSFYQINPTQTKVLYEAAISAANLSKEETILDAYSGVGTIGIIASDYVKKVISVELEKRAVEDAIINAKENNIKNIHFYCDDATRFINNLAAKKEHLDVIIMDPPRKGSDEAFLKAVLKIKPKKIIYVSCDPHTQVVDLKHLLNDYKIISVQPVDMFPNTMHVETVACLERK